MTLRVVSEEDMQLHAHGRWLRSSPPAALGLCHTDALNLAPGLTLLHNHYRPNADLAEFRSKALSEPVLTITVGLQGASAFSEQGGQTLDFASGKTTVTGFARVQGRRHYQAGVAVRQLRVQASQALLQTYLGEQRTRSLLAHGRLCQLACFDSGRTSLAHAQALLHHIVHAPDNVLALHAHALHLLGDVLHAIGAAPQASPPPAARDVAKLEEVRHWLQAHADQPVSIARLAEQLGWSESRLRRAFFRRYQQSPQAFHMQARMQLARQLLQGGCRVAETAYRLGYEHPANFSLAFARFFGHPPSRA